MCPVGICDNVWCKLCQTTIVVGGPEHSCEYWTGPIDHFADLKALRDRLRGERTQHEPWQDRLSGGRGKSPILANETYPPSVNCTHSSLDNRRSPAGDRRVRRRRSPHLRTDGRLRDRSPEFPRGARPHDPRLSRRRHLLRRGTRRCPHSTLHGQHNDRSRTHAWTRLARTA